jgi:hypothetical protein
VNKKNILLTIWLLLPITIVSLLMVWIFYSLDKDRLMDDAVPYGAGAGDTGNANAIGEWLAGNDADRISLAVKARREGVAIDPREWPGGITIRVPQHAVVPEGNSKVMICVTSDFENGGAITSMFLDHEGYFTATFSDVDDLGSLVFIGRGFKSTSELPTEIRDLDGRRLRSFSLPQIVPDSNLQVSDPMIVTLDAETVYLDAMP